MTKKKVAFVTDSTAYLTKELREHPDVYVVPIIIMSEGKEYRDGIDLGPKKLYDIIRKEKEVPKTSQPSIGTFKELYEQLKKDYDYAIAIHVSSKLSGTLSSSVAGKEQAGFDVEVIDSHSLSFAITSLLQKGLKMTGQGLDVKEIAQLLRKTAKTSKNLILLGSLEQLYKGGRMSGASFLLGNFLQIKPILSIDKEGQLGLLERVRSENKAIKKIMEKFKQSCVINKIKQVGIMHGNELEKAKVLKGQLTEVVSDVEMIIGDISSSLAVHAGEGSLALFWNEENK